MRRVRLGGKEWLEYARQNVLRYSASAVVEFNAYVVAGRQLDGGAFDRFIEALIVCAKRDASFLSHRFHGVFQNLHEALLHLCLVEIHCEQLLFKLERPKNVGRAGLLEQLHGAPEDVIQIAGGLGVGVLFLPAEGGQVLRDFRRFLRCLFHLHE